MTTVTLDLRGNTYTEARKHFDNILKCWAYMYVMDEREDAASHYHAEQSADDSYAWLREYTPWLVPYVDRAVIRMLTGNE